MKRKLSILLALVMAVSLILAPAAVSANDYDLSLELDNKTDTVPDGAWALTPGDGMGGTLLYNSSGPTFDFSFTATGLENVAYSLIYYADKPDRFVDWGGDNPGALIGTGTASNGVLDISDSVDLNMNLPCPPDANISEFDYSGTPDFYDHAHGAKIWLVPSSDWEGNSPEKLIAWNPDQYLFETDLITYNDTDIGVVVEGEYVAAVMTITPPTMTLFGTFVSGQNKIWSDLSGSVTVVKNSENPGGWTVTAKNTDSYGYMRVGGAGGYPNLTNRLTISADDSSYYFADEGCTWIGGSFPGAFSLWASQVVTNDDEPGTYEITITFTGNLTF